MDDYFSLVATVSARPLAQGTAETGQAFLIALAAVQVSCAKLGFGNHIWNFDWTNIVQLMRVGSPAWFHPTCLWR
jgi:hypothetical protein